MVCIYALICDNVDNNDYILSALWFIDSHRVQMTDDILMNLINLDGQLYIWSSEISLLFFSEDVLSAQVMRNINASLLLHYSSTLSQCHLITATIYSL